MSKDPKKLKVSPRSQKEKLAETASRYSDMPISLRLQLTKPIEAIAGIYLASFYQYWQTDTLIWTIAHRAFANSYQGKWELVQKLLELQTSKPEDIESFLIELNPYEFFGNILPLAVKIERRVVYKDLTRASKHKVVKAERHRGYRDKGSYRFPHERHGDPPISEREDRRKNISHPLLREVGKVKENPDSGDAEEHIQEGGIFHVKLNSNNIVAQSKAFEVNQQKDSAGATSSQAK